MKITTISVPKQNDSFSRMVLSGKQYLIRFTYNDTGDFWTFGIYTMAKEPIICGIKIVPMFPLNLFHSAYAEMPKGVFGAISKKDRIGRNDFYDGSASFVYGSEE